MKITVLHPVGPALARAFHNSKASDFKTVVLEGHLTDDQLRKVCYLAVEPVGDELRHTNAAHGEVTFYHFDRTETLDPAKMGVCP